MPYFGSWLNEGQVSGIDQDTYKRHKFRARVWDIPSGQSWETETRKMFDKVPDTIDGIPIDKFKTGMWNNSGIEMYVIAYSTPEGEAMYFGSWQNMGNNILDDGQYHTKYQAILYGIPVGMSWDKAGDYANRLLPKELDGKKIDQYYTRKWNNNGINFWMIIFTKGDPADKAGMIFDTWKSDGIAEDEHNGLQSKQYYSHVLNVPATTSWRDAGELMLRFVPATIENSKVIKTYAEDAGIRGLFVHAETEQKFGWKLADWGLTAGKADEFQSQVYGLTRKWEDFNATSVEAIKKQGLIPEYIGGRKVLPETLTYFQSALGVFLQVDVEPGWPWWVIPTVVVLGGVGAVGFVWNKSKKEG